MTPVPMNTLQSLSSIYQHLDEKTQNMVSAMWDGFHRSFQSLRNRSAKISRAQTGVNYECSDATSFYASPSTSIPVYLNPFENISDFKIVDTITGLDMTSIEVPELTWRQIYGSCTVTGAGIAEVSFRPKLLSEIIKNIGSEYVYIISGDTALPLASMWYVSDSDSTHYYLSTIASRLLNSGDIVRCGCCREFYVDASISSLPSLYTVSSDGTVQSFYDGSDYRFWPETHSVEFMSRRILDMMPCTMISEQATVINTDIMQWRGTSVGIDDYKSIQLDNNTIAASISSAEQAAFESGNLDQYKAAIATSYRIPVASAPGIVIGQFESVGYRLNQTSSGTWGLVTTIPTSITGRAIVDGVIYDISNSEISSGLDLSNSVAHIMVIGRYDVVQCFDELGSSVQTIAVLDPNGALNQCVEQAYQVCLAMYGDSVLPAVILEIGSKKSVFHCTPELSGQKTALRASRAVSITTYKFNPDKEIYPVYHDPQLPMSGDPATGTGSSVMGTMIFMDPNHKMILVDYDGVICKYYIDGPMYSRLNPGDTVEAGEVLVENLIVSPYRDMAGVESLECFRYSDKSGHANSIFEVVQVNQTAFYGKDLPNQATRTE